MSSKGFKKKTRTEIVEDMKTRAIGLLGDDINLAISGPLGILLELFSWPISLVWAGLEQVYSAYYIGTSTGQDLDNLAKNIAISRIRGAKAQGEIIVSGEEGTLIPSGFRVSTDTYPAIIYETTSDAIIDQNGEKEMPVVAVEQGSSGNVTSNSITEIINPKSGIDSVTNPEPTSGGRDRETDAEFRARYLESLDRPGGSTINSIRANILENTGSISCIVLQNTTNETDENGLPPKSFEAITLGGEDAEIAEAILEKSPGGIEPFGQIGIYVEDDSGNDQLVSFSRATQVDIYCEIELDVSGDYPQDGDEQVINRIVDYIGGINTDGDSVSGLSISEDVIRNKLIAAVIKNVSGVDDIPYLALGLNDSELEEDNIAIAFREVARTEPGLIEVSQNA